MFVNYIKIVLRNLNKYKLFSFINIFGLAIAFTTCMLIAFWVQKETSYDRFHQKSERIYRVERELFRDNLYSRWPITSGGYKDALISDFPEIENAVRIWRRTLSIKDHFQNNNRQQVFAVDNSLFSIFNFDLEEGDPTRALDEPMTTVLTRANALKYFGTEDVIGKTLTVEWGDESADFQVTGIIKEIPENSHVKFDMLISISSYPDERFAQWRSNYLYTYVLVKENIARASLEENLKTFITHRLEAVYTDLTGTGADIHDVLKMHLVPITDIHLHPSENWEIETGGNVSDVYIFISIAVLILVIACINFINLSTARAVKRAKEVCLRKTVGATIPQLRGQFILETMVLAGGALLLAFIFIISIVPFYNASFDNHISAEQILNIQNVLFFLGITLLVGMFAGTYPAFYLTKFDPARVLKSGAADGHGKTNFRRNMVIVQFVISITLMIGMFTVYRQMHHIQNLSLGYDKENMIIIPVRSQSVVQGYETYRNKLLINSDITAVAASADLPGDRIFSNTGFFDPADRENSASVLYMVMDYDFIDTYRMELLAGRAFSRSFGTDSAGTIIMNEAAVKRFGWTPETAVGKQLGYFAGTRDVVGVVRDYNFKSVHSEIEPLLLILAPNQKSAISARIQGDGIRETLGFMEQVWKSHFPGDQFEFTFLDDRLDQLYKNENNMKKIFIGFAVLSIIVACLGLIGLATFTAEIRTKEIGIRKVLGASTGKVVQLLSREYLKWIIISNLIAWPIAWFMMNKWLQNFAYRVSVSWWMFGLAFTLAMCIALLSVGYQSIKAANANPVKSLHYE